MRIVALLDLAGLKLQRQLQQRQQKRRSSRSAVRLQSLQRQFPDRLCVGVNGRLNQSLGGLWLSDPTEEIDHRRRKLDSLRTADCSGQDRCRRWRNVLQSIVDKLSNSLTVSRRDDSLQSSQLGPPRRAGLLRLSF